jgi:hypothetical protein
MAFKMKGFKAHNMYKKEIANTKSEHEALEKEGFGHSPYSKVDVYQDLEAELDNYNLKKKRELNYKPQSSFKKAKGIDGKACWKGYKLQGTKKKGGKTVDNCVKI